MGVSFTLGRDGKIYLPVPRDVFADTGGTNGSVAAQLAAIKALGVSAANSAIDTEVANLTEHGNVGDVTITGSSTTVDYTTRDSDGFDAEANASKSIEVTGVSNVRDSQATLDILEQGYDDQVEVAALILSGDRTAVGRRGYIGNWTVTAFTEAQPVKGIITVSWTLKAATVTRYKITA